ncbi:membrane hypothetical protein [Crenothrix polyspora]|uniref:Uncharacterized protein n=1 Tax=Crenothrix polyspora TaxID=360316 RepID=A0A1R4H5I2_9GAMM|nr:hypothetical protein [Crenothrix polyspora]SJM91504.1 membrane hypothetical protein [Crenothrix polyspora]
MTSITFKQIIYRLSIMGVILGILINTYDILIGTFLETLHILFEVIESILDKIVESVFHTGIHDTQTIVFYLMLAGGLAIIYYLSHAILNLYHALMDTSQSCVDACRRGKIGAELYWHDLPLLNKITWIGCLMAVFILSLMFFGLM